MTRSIPSCPAIAWAVPIVPGQQDDLDSFLAQVSDRVGRLGLSVSATATTPTISPSTPTSMAVLPSCSSRLMTCFDRTRIDAFALEQTTAAQEHHAAFDAAADALPRHRLKSSTAGNDNPRCCAARTIASPNGCSEPTSTAAASRKTFSSGPPASGTMSVTFGSPRVSVPVLSNTTVVSLRARSSTSAPRMRIPSPHPCRPRPSARPGLRCRAHRGRR